MLLEEVRESKAIEAWEVKVGDYYVRCRFQRSLKCRAAVIKRLNSKTRFPKVVGEHIGDRYLVVYYKDEELLVGCHKDLSSLNSFRESTTNCASKHPFRASSANEGSRTL